jgi:hypothetical chaperone protein
VDLATVVERAFFEEWISEELEQIARCVDSLLSCSRVLHKDVNMVFLTGGSSFVPAVRKIFETRFGKKANSGRKRVYVSSPRIGAESDGLTYLPVSSSVRH